MPPFHYKIVNQSKDDIPISESVVHISNNKWEFNFPCTSTYDCTDFEIIFSPGVYQIELYGASGGFKDNRVTSYRSNCKCPEAQPLNIKTNVQCLSIGSVAGAGGYTSGIINLKDTTTAFLSIGGKGSFYYTIENDNSEDCYIRENMVKGGYNGGGWAANYYKDENGWGAGGGGGATDLRFDVNDLYHRVIVAGGGGGPDNPGNQCGEDDDGSGGAGGGLIAQSFYTNGVENTNLRATQTNGFTFGYGESARKDGSLNPNNSMTAVGRTDRSGGGGGWFGGYASHHGNSGSGGGSSFILTESASIPNYEIESYDSFYTPLDKKRYAFINQKNYLFTSPIMYSGVWAGNGFAIITQLSFENCSQNDIRFFKISLFVYIFCIL